MMAITDLFDDIVYVYLHRAVNRKVKTQHADWLLEAHGCIMIGQSLITPYHHCDYSMCSISAIIFACVVTIDEAACDRGDREYQKDEDREP